MFGYSLKFIVGIVLLFTNQLLAWGGMLLCAFLYRRTEKRVFMVLGPLVYAFSWIVFAAGVVLAGSEGVSLIKRVSEPYRWQTAAVGGIVFTGAVIYAWKSKRKEKPPFAGPSA